MPPALDITPWHWAGFVGCVVVMLALDLGVFHRRGRVVRFREALGWTSLWVCLAAAFAGWIHRYHDPQKAVLFATGYIVELSLSMDNVFVMAVIFRYFQVPPPYQHRVLFWGILGALAMRGVLIGAGTALVHRFAWLLYVLGAFLVFTGIKMFFTDDDGVHPERNPVIRLARRFCPVTSDYVGQRFVTRWDGVWALTPLAIVLLMVETTDLIFATDSLPAIFGITQDAFIVFTSNVFAILGLRSLYFVLAGAIEYFSHLKKGLSLVLLFIGVRMIVPDRFHPSTTTTLGVVAGIIALSILASILIGRARRES
jgi:tellurite resistance protein TerC